MRRVVLHNYFPGWARDDGATFKESDHPRINNGPKAGQFAPKGGGGGSSGGEAKGTITTSTGHKLNPYFQKKFHEPTSKEDWVKQASAVFKMQNAHPGFQQVCGMLLATANKHQIIPEFKAQIQTKIIESLSLQAKNLKEVGALDKAKKIEAKIADWQKTAGGSPVAAPAKPAPALAPTPSEFPQPTPEELQQAKSTAPYMTYYAAPAEAQPLIKAFNEKYTGKALTDPEALAEKVSEFKQLKSQIATIKSAKAKIAEAKQAEEAKHIMSTLGINEEQTAGFLGLASMMAGHGYPIEKLLTKFKHLEDKAKNYDYPISGFECALIESYSDGSYMDVNSELRRGTWSEQTHVYVKMLNSALKKLPPYTGIVTRGASLSPEQQNAYVVGSIVEERAFTSTSTDKGFGGNTQFTITAKGRRGANIKKLSDHPGENEVLFQARTFFKVTKAEAGKDKYGDPVRHIHMEEWEE